MWELDSSSLVQFALVWYLTRESGSATILATATLFAMLPQIVLGPFAGALVDRLNRRVIIMIADGVIMFATLGLVFLFASGTIEIWHIYAMMFLRGLGGAFHWPAMQASTSLMVPKKHLARIAGMNQTLQGAINIVAPPTGAILIEVISTQNVLLIDVGTALIAILPLFFIPIPQPVRENGQKASETRFWQDLKEGFTYVAAWPGLLAILIMITMINFLLSPTGSLMPLLVTKHFGGGALQFGLMDSFWGGGVILGGVLLSVWGGFKRKIVTSMVGLIGIGIGIMLVGFSPASAFNLALGGMFLAGIMVAFANGPMMAIIQSSVRPDMQGRVMSLVGSAAMAMSPLGLIIAGPISDWLGIRTWYWIGGGMTLLMGIVSFSIPAIMNIENNRKER
ncbi:MAG: MFS transporter [Anaerolineae bacterium]|nr:MFS transporter [Anaerolineae bacterium]MBT7075236.1 MFS transporter [Anaerolineae bacterium]